MPSSGKLISAPGRGERVFTIFVFLLASGAFTALMGNEESATGKGIAGIIMQAIWSIIYLSALFLFRRTDKRFLDIVRKDKLLFLLVALAMASLFWSEDPGLTFRRSVAVAGTTLFGVYFASRFSLADQLRLLSRVLLIGAVLSPIVVVILPQYGRMSPGFGYAWQGIYGHKNNLGAAMALGVVVFSFRAFMNRNESLKWWAATGLALGVLLLAHSSTGLAVCVMTLLVFALAPALRWRTGRAISFFVMAGVAALGVVMWALNNLPLVLSLVSREQSFTGRTTIWMVSIAMITRHPWLGYGYNEFWPAYGSDIVARLTGLTEMSHAHNAILNLWLDIGLLGVLIFILQFCKSLWCAIAAVRHSNTVEGLWPLVFLFFLATYGLVESVVLQRNSLSWILCTAVMVQVSSPQSATLSTLPLSKAKSAAA